MAENGNLATNEPRCLTVTVSRSQKGNVALKDYGRLSSGYDVFMSRTYEVPENWTEEQVDEFQLAKHDHLVELIEPIDQENYEERAAQADPGVQ
jgi:hypothetical protein